MTEKDMFLSRWGAETQTTLKVLNAFPSSQANLKPSEKIRSAKDLMMAFVTEQTLAHGAVAGKMEFGNGANAPATIGDIIKLFEKSSSELSQKVKAMPDADWESSMDFVVGPKQLAKVRRGDVLWFILSDMIHHRGQISVYVRIAGGTVPSIYGPTLEEPWM